MESRMVDEETHLRLVNGIDAFLSRIRTSAETLDVVDRQKILRLIVKEILVSADTVTIRHSIPVTSSGPKGTPAPSRETNTPSYLLCGRSQIAALWSPHVGSNKLFFREDARFEERTDEPVHLSVSTAATDSL